MNYLAGVAVVALIVVSLTAAQKKDEKKPSPPVSFSKDVMPVLAKKCLDCHTTEDDNSNKFYVDTYELLFQDAKHGPAIIRGNGNESIIIKKMRGTTDFGKAMPKRGKPVPDSVIAIIAKWIDQGAKKN